MTCSDASNWGWVSLQRSDHRGALRSYLCMEIPAACPALQCFSLVSFDCVSSHGVMDNTFKKRHALTKHVCAHEFANKLHAHKHVVFSTCMYTMLLHFKNLEDTIQTSQGDWQYGWTSQHGSRQSSEFFGTGGTGNYISTFSTRLIHKFLMEWTCLSRLTLQSITSWRSDPQVSATNGFLQDWSGKTTHTTDHHGIITGKPTAVKNDRECLTKS